MRRLAVIVLMAAAACSVRAGEEKIRGLLEKTVHANACAQITDALSEVYYITKSDDAEKMIANFLGKNEKVVITGTVEQKEGDPSYYFTLKSIEAYAPKMPPAPAPVAPAAPVVPPPALPTFDPNAKPPAAEAKKPDAPAIPPAPAAPTEKK